MIIPFTVRTDFVVCCVPVLVSPVRVTDIIVGNHIGYKVIDMKYISDGLIVFLIFHVFTSKAEHLSVIGSCSIHCCRSAVFHCIIIIIVPAQVLSGKIIIRSFMKLTDSPQDSVNIKQDMMTSGRESSHGRVQVGRELVMGVLRSGPLTLTAVIMPYIIEAVVQDQSIKTRGSIIPV